MWGYVVNRYFQRGDTIIEVLISVAIASSVLAITFSTMNRNIRTMRDNQEHTEASKIAQTQAEALMDIWNRDSSLITDMSNDGFCITPAGSMPKIDNGASPTDNPEADDYAQYDAVGCQTDDEIYNYGIKRNGSGAYVITVRWFKLGATTRNERVIVYKLN